VLTYSSHSKIRKTVQLFVYSDFIGIRAEYPDKKNCSVIAEIGSHGKCQRPSREITTLTMIEKLLQLMIRAYQLLLSPFLGNHCRFTPSCSHYASECITRYGAWRGGWLTLKRLARCQPFCDGGYDPVP